MAKICTSGLEMAYPHKFWSIYSKSKTGMRLAPGPWVHMFYQLSLYNLHFYGFQYSLPELSTHLSVQVRNIILHGDLLRGRSLPIHVVRQNMDGAELEFSNLLIEDTNNDAMSYIDCKSSIILRVMAVIMTLCRFMLCAQADQPSSESQRNNI